MTFSNIRKLMSMSNANERARLYCSAFLKWKQAFARCQKCCHSGWFASRKLCAHFIFKNAICFHKSPNHCSILQKDANCFWYCKGREMYWKISWRVARRAQGCVPLQSSGLTTSTELSAQNGVSARQRSVHKCSRMSTGRASCR